MTSNPELERDIQSIIEGAILRAEEMAATKEEGLNWLDLVRLESESAARFRELRLRLARRRLTHLLGPRRFVEGKVMRLAVGALLLGGMSARQRGQRPTSEATTRSLLRQYLLTEEEEILDRARTVLKQRLREVKQSQQVERGRGR